MKGASMVIISGAHGESARREGAWAWMHLLDYFALSLMCTDFFWKC
jgi:hypothetical protein